jgi:hypothetical protein
VGTCVLDCRARSLVLSSCTSTFLSSMSRSMLCVCSHT